MRLIWVKFGRVFIFKRGAGMRLEGWVYAYCIVSGEF